MADSVSLKVETNLPVPMRDGTVLYADLYRPDGPGPFPVMLQRTPYDKSGPLPPTQLDPLRAAQRGYAVVIQDCRGRFASGGEYYPFKDHIDDGYDTVEWAAAQPWSSGKAGMYGASYNAATQWLASLARPPHLSALAPNVTASNYHEGWVYQGGAFELQFNVSWTVGTLAMANFDTISSTKKLPEGRRRQLIEAVDSMESSFGHLPLKELPHLKDGVAPYYYDWLAHPDYDDYWRELSIEENYSRISVPAFHIGGWYDIFLGAPYATILAWGRPVPPRKPGEVRSC